MNQATKDNLLRLLTQVAEGQTDPFYLAADVACEEDKESYRGQMEQAENSLAEAKGIIEQITPTDKEQKHV